MKSKRQNKGVRVAQEMKISILFGGSSFEHEISIVSAISLKKVLTKQIAHFIFLDSAHRFYLIPSEQMQTKTFTSLAYKQCKELECVLGGFATRTLFGSTKLVSDLGVLLSVVHGGDGEDGKISSLLEFYKIPFIAPRTQACVLSYNKILTKIYAKALGVNVLPYEHYRKGDTITPGIDYPFIIKPATSGSSIGIGIVERQEDLEYALDSAFAYDNEVLMEPFNQGVKEYNLAGYKNSQGEIVFSIVEKPKKSNFLSFDDKYLDFSRTQAASKADITKALESKLQEAFRKIYGAMFEGALIRCDFFVIDKKVYLNEINPIPGSMANYLFADFASNLAEVAQSLPRAQYIKVSYNYIDTIHKAKGK